MRNGVFVVVGLLGIVLLMGAKGGGLIENTYPQLLGKYRFLKSVDNKTVSYPSQALGTCSVQITGKDQLITIQKLKKTEKVKYHFISTKMPFLEDERHILYGRKNAFQAMFYRADTIVIENFPIPYTENYFLKIRDEDK